MRQKITMKMVLWTAVLGTLLIMTMVTVHTLMNSRQTDEATNEAVSAVSSFYLETMADSHAKTITNLISNSFNQMQIATAYIGDEEIRSQGELRDAIGNVKSLLGLNRFALVDEDDVVHTRYTTYTGRSRHSFLAEGELKERTVSVVSLYGSSRQLCLAIPTPDLMIMGKRYKACFVQFDIKDIVDLLAVDNQGRTNFALYSKTGTNLSGTELGPVISNRNFLEAIKGIVPEGEWNKNCMNFANDAEGTLSFEYAGANETLCYVPIEGADWEVAVLIRESVIQDQIRDISEKNLNTSVRQIIITSAAVLALALILLIQIGMLSRQRIEEEKASGRVFLNMANTDSMTGVRNKHAYTEQESALNDRILSGEFFKLAVVVGDINGLKYVNDTLGHAAGDKLIKDACALICEYFKHGAVFRIGGDEFVVLLQGEGYDTMNEVIDRFNRKVEDNIKKKDVVVSIGYSVLEKEDQHMSDVFERADRMMYERKKELKAMGTPTRS